MLMLNSPDSIGNLINRPALVPASWSLSRCALAVTLGEETKKMLKPGDEQDDESVQLIAPTSSVLGFLRVNLLGPRRYAWLMEKGKLKMAPPAGRPAKLIALFQHASLMLMMIISEWQLASFGCWIVDGRWWMEKLCHALLKLIRGRPDSSRQAPDLTFRVALSLSVSQSLFLALVQLFSASENPSACKMFPS